MPYRADKIPPNVGTRLPKPRRLMPQSIYNDLRGIGLLAGLILRRHDMALMF
jgi:hypothetical protein